MQYFLQIFLGKSFVRSGLTQQQYSCNSLGVVGTKHQRFAENSQQATRRRVDVSSHHDPFMTMAPQQLERRHKDWRDEREKAWKGFDWREESYDCRDSVNLAR